jgi:hypothetical protein
MGDRENFRKAAKPVPASGIEALHRVVRVVIALVIIGAGAVSYPDRTSEPAASPVDKAKEDLSRFEYPSQGPIPWRPHFLRPQDSLERLFGADWMTVARFNRLDRRHAYPGMTIKVPEDMAAARTYTPLPVRYETAGPYPKYILLDLTEQWLGAYEYGVLRLSMPAATGTAEHPTPTGFFRVTARDRTHTSSLYKTEKEDAQYPMDYALMFYVGPDGVAFWIHARDLPGRPASHGCVGVYDEFMQLRTYGTPEVPVLFDSRTLYDWAVGDERHGIDSGTHQEIFGGPVVEIRGELPRRLDKPPDIPPYRPPY